MTARERFAAELEAQLIDVVLRHAVVGVGLDVEDFGYGWHRQIWQAVLDLYARNETPSVLGVHAQMVRNGHHHNDGDALHLLCILPVGCLVDLEDLAGLVAENGRLRRLRLAYPRVAA